MLDLFLKNQKFPSSSLVSDSILVNDLERLNDILSTHYPVSSNALHLLNTNIKECLVPDRVFKDKLSLYKKRKSFDFLFSGEKAQKDKKEMREKLQQKQGFPALFTQLYLLQRLYLIKSLFLYCISSSDDFLKTHPSNRRRRLPGLPSDGTPAPAGTPCHSHRQPLHRA